MKYVIDKDGKIVIGAKGGIMIDPENGGEPYEMDVFGIDATITSLRAEAKEHRTKKAEYKAIVDAIPEEIRANPKAASEALITVSSLGEKHKTDMEKVKSELEKSYKAANDANQLKITELNNQLFNEKVTSRFSTSKALDGTIFNKTREVAISHFKNHFSVDETGNMVGKYKDGNPIYSKTNPGKLADFDECISCIIEADPNKDSYIAPSNKKGSGFVPSGGSSNDSPTGGVNRIKAGLESRQNQ